jgi:hypothetical protein
MSRVTMLSGGNTTSGSPWAPGRGGPNGSPRHPVPKITRNDGLLPTRPTAMHRALALRARPRIVFRRSSPEVPRNEEEIDYPRCRGLGCPGPRFKSPWCHKAGCPRVQNARRTQGVPLGARTPHRHERKIAHCTPASTDQMSQVAPAFSGVRAAVAATVETRCLGPFRR